MCNPGEAIMKKVLTVLLALGLVSVFSSGAMAGVLGYNLDQAGMKGFTRAPREEPSAAVVAGDALIARPIGLGLTIAGTATFLITLPMSIPSQSVGNAAEGLIVKPGGYTFVRPLGRSEPRFEERTLFGE
jgi:hypothetical protein